MCNGTQGLVREIENFERSGVNLLCYIEKKNGTAVLLREIENFERSEFEPSRVTCIFSGIKTEVMTLNNKRILIYVKVINLDMVSDTRGWKKMDEKSG